MQGKPILHIEELGKQIELLHGEKRILFKGVSAQVYPSSVIALLGASGQGKSTLLRILAMLDKADEGTVRFRGQICQEASPQAWRKQIGYVAQQSVMLEGSVQDNLRAVSMLHKEPFDAGLARDLMTKVGLEEMDWGKRASDLSGGEKQRVALVRSMLLKPELFLLDEVTASLDTHSKQAVEQLLLEWHREHGTAMIWVTHDLEQALLTSNQVWFMGENTLLETSPTDLFFTRPITVQGRKFAKITEETEV